MSGIPQGPISGELIAQLASGEAPEIDLVPFYALPLPIR
jgi:glycine/D-amino acid oxidase-like deaminating enzyme